VSAPKAPPTAKKKEGWLGIVITALCCVGFLVFWFGMDPLPPPVGPAGLFQRAQQELKSHAAAAEIQGTSPEGLALQFDLLELALLHARAADFPQAQTVADAITVPELTETARQHLALGILHQEGGDFTPALKILSATKDPAAQHRLRTIIALELALIGMDEAALDLAKEDLGIQAKICRQLAESADQAKAREMLPKLEKALTPPPAEAHVELARARLWLRDTAAVEKILPQLPAAAQDELWQDLFRLVRLEQPDQALALLGRVPAHLRMALRIESGQMASTFEPKENVLRDLRAAATSSSDLLALAVAEWKLGEPESQWRQSLQQAETQASGLSPAAQGSVLAKIAQLLNDASAFSEAEAKLAAAQQAAAREPDTAARVALEAQLFQQAFLTSAPELAETLLNRLHQSLQATSGTPEQHLLLAKGLFRAGKWPQALHLITPSADPALMPALAQMLAESTASPGYGLCQDQSWARLRQTSASQGEEAAIPQAVRSKIGLERSRAWLQVAKGLLMSPP
jgi:hypothetical protein